MKKRGVFDEAISCLELEISENRGDMDEWPITAPAPELRQIMAELRAAISVLKACEGAEIVFPIDWKLSPVQTRPRLDSRGHERIARAILAARKIAEKQEQK
jgi:hypothetical protein